jgi:hypothetical protein
MSDRYDEMAREIVERLSNGVGFRVVGSDSLEADIAAALRAAATVPEGHVREGTTDRKVLGALPVTAEGEIIGGLDDYQDVVLWSVHPKDGEIREMTTPAYWSELGDWRVNSTDAEPDGSFVCQPLSWCYSTRAAAEAARGGE